jgi:hypothetical protein
MLASILCIVSSHIQSHQSYLTPRYSLAGSHHATSLAPTMSAVSYPPTINTFVQVTAPHSAWPSAFPTSESQADVVRSKPSFVRITPTLPDIHPAIPSQENQLADEPVDQDGSKVSVLDSQPDRQPVSVSYCRR